MLWKLGSIYSIPYCNLDLDWKENKREILFIEGVNKAIVFVQTISNFPSSSVINITRDEEMDYGYMANLIIW